MLRRGRTTLVSAVITIAAACTAGTATMHVSYGPDIVIGMPLAASSNLAGEGAMAKQEHDLWLVNGEQVQGGRPRTVWPLQLAASAARHPAPTWAVRTGIPDPPAEPPKLPATGVRPAAG